MEFSPFFILEWGEMSNVTIHYSASDMGDSGDISPHSYAGNEICAHIQVIAQFCLKKNIFPFPFSNNRSRTGRSLDRLWPAWEAVIRNIAFAQAMNTLSLF